MTPRERRKARNQLRRAREQARKQNEGKQSADRERKFNKAVAAGVDPDVAARAFDYTRPGTTDVTVIQSKEGVGVTARTNEAGATTRQQATFGLDTDLGRQSAIPLNAQGQTPMDERAAFNRATSSPQMVDFGPLRFAGRAAPLGTPIRSSNIPISAGEGVPRYPIEFPVFGPVDRKTAPFDNTEYLRDVASGRAELLYTPASASVYAGSQARGRGLFRLNLDTRGMTRREVNEQTALVTFGGTGIRIPRSSIEPGLSRNENLDLLAAEVRTLGPDRDAGRPSAAIARGEAIRTATFPVRDYRSAIQPFIRTIPQKTAAIITTTGIAASLPEVGSRIGVRGRDRDVFNTPAFESSYQAGLRAREAELNPVGRFVEFLPGIGPKINDLVTGGRTQDAFVAGVRGDAASRLDVEASQINRFSNIAMREQVSRGRGAGAGIVLAQFPSEVVGRTVYGSAAGIRYLAARPGVRAFVSTLPAGFLEGSTGFFIERQGRRLDADPQSLLVAGGAGALTAGLASGFIIGNAGKVRGRVAQGLLNTLDPPELAGDAAADLFVTDLPRGVRVPTFVNPQEFVNTRVFDSESVSAARPAASAGSPGSVSVTASNPLTSTNVRTTARVDPLSAAQSFVELNTRTLVRQPSSLDNVFARTNVNPNPRPRVTPTPSPFVPVRSPVNVPTRVTPNPIVNINTNVNPFVQPRTNPFARTTPFSNVNTFNTRLPFAFPFSGVSKKGFAGAAIRGRRGFLNTPSIIATLQPGFDASKARRRVSGRSFTGIEVRGL